MRKFVQRHQEQILGVLSGFDRMRFRGSLRLLQSEGGVATWLECIGVAVKDFLSFAEGLTKRLCRQSDRLAEAWGRKVQYLPGVVDKEDLVQEIREQEGVAENGLVAVLSTLEMGMSDTMFRGRDRDFPVLRSGPRKCKNYHFYWDDGRFGLTQVRVSSWFPFDVHVVLNGREWLARQMDAQGIDYLRRDNCFVRISDFHRVQKLADGQPKIKWIGQLNRLLRRVHPLHAEVFSGPGVLDYYWTSDQTEWATDIVFRDGHAWKHLYQTLIRRGIEHLARAVESGHEAVARHGPAPVELVQDVFGNPLQPRFAVTEQASVAKRPIVQIVENGQVIGSRAIDMRPALARFQPAFRCRDQRICCVDCLHAEIRRDGVGSE